MTLDLIIFIVLAVIAVAASVAMLASDNAVYSAMFLVLTMAVLAVFFVILNAPFIAMVQVTVYAGAIMVLFIFVIMLLGAERLTRAGDRLAWQRPLAVFLGVALVGATAAALLARGGAEAVPQPFQPEMVEAFGSPLAIGQQLFTAYLFPFEVTSVLLLVAMVGAIVLTKEERVKVQKRTKPGK